MSSMKGGFSTLNRWFGRKKDKTSTGSTSIGKLSKSTTQLHHLSTDTDINETSQLEYNRITPVPAATSNAPFEQTFRITVLLPKDQLFVARLGARVPLSKLLSLVCDNKQLDADKYEFRSPVDASQVYSCESTIGAVGLSEIRLCHKSESYDNFNPDAMHHHKFQRTGIARDSLSSSSDFSSSRHSKVTAKTPSPYSSSNSLNSMDSTGMNYTRTPVVVPPPQATKVMAPPPRKKRAAPRPPNQICIPEQSVPDIPSTVGAGGGGGGGGGLKSEPAYAVIVKRPQLCMSTPNLSAGQLELDCNGNSSKSLKDEDSASDGHYATLDLKQPPSVSGPEPTPRKRIIQIKKKTAPAPPPGEDTISLASIPEPVTPTASVPQPAPRITSPLPVGQPPLPVSAAPQVNGNGSGTPNGSMPGTPNAMSLDTNKGIPNGTPNGTPLGTPNGNVSKVLLNRTPTPEPRSLGSATEEDDNDAASKQADSGIGEPVPSPSSVTPEPEAEKSQQESSSEDDEAIKVYNFKLCQTSSKKEKEELITPPVATSLAELAVLTAAAAEDEEEVGRKEEGQMVNTPSSASEQTSLSSWNYSVPISPPPDFSDQQGRQRSAGSMSPGSPLDEIVDELSAIINHQGLDTLIKKQPDPRLAEIEAAKPNRLANFSIATATAKSTTRITRADSFQAGSGAEAEVTSPGGGALSLRSTSHVSLNKLEQQNGYSLGQRRSSSELSIGESPSLQSLEVIKTILNSRKNSLAESGGSTSPTVEQPKSIKQEQPKEETTVDGGNRALAADIVKEQQPSPRDLPSPVTFIAPSPTPVQEASPKPMEKQKPVPVAKPVSPVIPRQVVSLVQQQESPSVIKKESPPVAKKESPSPVAKDSPPPVAKDSPPPVAKKDLPIAKKELSPPVQRQSPSAVSRLILDQTPVQKLDAAPVAVSTTPPNTPASPATSPAVTMRGNTGQVESPQPARKPIEMSPSSKPMPPTYRYSGPPSINFATWSERPKSQVAIKNEGDYIFGGAGKAQGMQSPPPAAAAAGASNSKLTIEVASPILRMGISQRKEYHVPITVKPLKDVAIPEAETEKIPEEVKSQPQVQVQVQPQVKQQVQNQATNQNLSSTLPRPAKSHRFTLPAGGGNHHIQTVTSTSSSNSLPRPVSSLERNTRPAAEAVPTPAPFGQNTLRRTGFKERMLAREQLEQEQALSIRVSVNGTAPAPTAAPTPTPAPAKATVVPVSIVAPIPAPKPTSPKPTLPAKNVQQPVFKTTKVEVKLQQEPEESTKPVVLQVKLRPSSQPVVTAATTTTPPPPPPPQQQVQLKPVKSSSVGRNASGGPMADPRSQLLEAIRNFKREELNRS
ncbi:hypothetical protein KR200_005701 [Drosophila serrata]|nr:hypothetical protein KR200_005701 [Drosophila serrata]